MYYYTNDFFKKLSTNICLPPFRMKETCCHKKSRVWQMTRFSVSIFSLFLSSTIWSKWQSGFKNSVAKESWQDLLENGCLLLCMNQSNQYRAQETPSTHHSAAHAQIIWYIELKVYGALKLHWGKASSKWSQLNQLFMTHSFPKYATLGRTVFSNWWARGSTKKDARHKKYRAVRCLLNIAKGTTDPRVEFGLPK